MPEEEDCTGRNIVARVHAVADVKRLGDRLLGAPVAVSALGPTECPTPAPRPAPRRSPAPASDPVLSLALATISNTVTMPWMPSFMTQSLATKLVAAGSEAGNLDAQQTHQATTHRTLLNQEEVTNDKLPSGRSAVRHT